jgi:iron complex outermembrane receptor protein
MLEAVIASAGFVVAAGGPAFAQVPVKSDGLTEIVVTAERRSQSLQDVAIAASVLTAETLAKRAVDDIQDLQQVAPAIAINTVNRSTFVNIRGVGLAQSSPTSVPGVAFYVDGQLIPHEQYIRQSFYDFEAVEVLRGPQGTLNGANSTGGAIYIRTPAPDFEEVSGYVDASGGNFDRYRAVGAINIPLGRLAAIRVSGVHEEMSSFADNIGPSPTEPGEFDQNGVRVNLAVRSPGERLRVNVRAEHFDFDSAGSAVKKRNDAVTSDPFTIEEDAISFLDQSGYRLSGEIRFAVTTAVDLRTMTSYQDGRVRDQVDGDRTATALPVPANLPTSGANRAIYPGRVTYSGTDFETLINEVNLISTGKVAFQWVLGAFTLKETVPVFVLRDNRNTRDFVASSSTIQATAENKSTALFGQASYLFDPRWEAVVGARYNWDEQDYDRTAPPGGIGRQESEELTGKAGLSFYADGDTLFYASVSKGYKAGGVNLTANTPNFGPETNVVYEGGFKLTRFDGQMRLNGAIFYSDYQDIQFASIQAGLPVQQNASAGEALGGELEIFGRVGGVDYNLGVAYLDGQFAAASCINNNLNPAGNPACTAGNDLVPKGRSLPFAPKWMVNAGLEYAFDLGGGLVLTPRAQAGYTSRQWATPFPGAATVLDARTIVDARLTLDVGERYTIEAYGTNILDERYAAAQIGNSTGADGGIVYGAPLQYGVRAVVRL